MSSIQSEWEQALQIYLAHTLGSCQGISLSISFTHSGWSFSGFEFFKDKLRTVAFVLPNRTVFRMVDPFQFHCIAATWAEQGIFVEAFLKTLPERAAGSNAIPLGVRRCVGGEDIGEGLPHFAVADIAMKAVIADALKPFRRKFLYWF